MFVVENQKITLTITKYIQVTWRV